MPRASSLACAVLVAATLAPAVARADVEWHRDLETARAAARISRRPVLAVFVATWVTGSGSFESTCLRSPESEAVMATCFEPVRIDIDENPALTRTVGISHVPTACVLAADDTVLASFEMPGSPAAFVTAAILAAQRAHAADQEATAPGAEPVPAMRLGAAPEPATATAAAFGSVDANASGGARPPRGSMARVAAKVRDLSAFAMGQSRMAPVAAPVAIASASRTVVGPRSDAYASLPWPAEAATAPPTQPVGSPTIEPAPLAPLAPTPWLDAPPPRVAAPVQPVPQPETPTQLPATAPADPRPAARQAGLMAALQKPFGWGAPAAEPPTMPPALPRGPFAPPPPAASEPAAVAADAAPRADDVDSRGSMPLGLEGYCPVTLVDRGVWTEGRAQWGARHRGRTYLFAGVDEQRTFLADPDRYAPALSGDDPVLALDRGSATPGQRRYGVTYQSRVYLFATPETRTAFTSDPGRYTARIAVAERAPTATRLY